MCIRGTENRFSVSGNLERTTEVLSCLDESPVSRLEGSRTSAFDRTKSRQNLNRSYNSNRFAHKLIFEEISDQKYKYRTLYMLTALKKSFLHTVIS